MLRSVSTEPAAAHCAWLTAKPFNKLGRHKLRHGALAILVMAALSGLVNVIADGFLAQAATCLFRDFKKRAHQITWSGPIDPPGGGVMEQKDRKIGLRPVKAHKKRAILQQQK